VTLKDIKAYLLKDTIVRQGETEAVNAYDIWSSSYDDQPDNLMLALDDTIFEKLINSCDLENKNIIDIGCGTGRHWQKILDKKPLKLTGYDISEGMLLELHKKFPDAVTYKITNNQYLDLPSASIDLIICTLTIAHIKDIHESLEAWFRVLKENGSIIITDFHPMALSKGGKRTFQNGGSAITIKNYIHFLDSIKNFSHQHNFFVKQEEAIKIGLEHKHFYKNKNALRVFQKFNGTPIIYGLHLTGNYGTS
jgi:ubiquinone/menaquinone biosynthesis C-methylase UbiE